MSSDRNFCYCTLATAFLLVALIAGPQLGAQEPVPVEVSEVVSREVATGRTFVGTVFPSRRAVIGSAVEGRVETVYVEEGDAVDMEDVEENGPLRGQALIQLRTRTIALEVAAAAAEVRLNEEELRQLETGSRPEEIVRAEALHDGAEAAHSYHRSRYDRTRSLFDRGGTITEEEVEEALAALIEAQQARSAARAELDLVKQGPREEEIAQARARLDMAREQQARLEDIFSKYTIRTPFAGYVVQKMTETGAWVNRGDLVAEVVELDPVELTVSVPEAFISHIATGMEATVSLDALPDELIIGTVHRVVPQADVRSRAFPVKIRIENRLDPFDRPMLKSGMLAHVTLPVGSPRRVLMVPKDALVLDGGRKSVVLLDEESQVQVVSVRSGASHEGLIEIIDDHDQIQAGAQVIVRGNERIRPNSVVRVLRFVPAERFMSQ